jgi:hypothetical protein
MPAGLMNVRLLQVSCWSSSNWAAFLVVAWGVPVAVPDSRFTWLLASLEAYFLSVKWHIKRLAGQDYRPRFHALYQIVPLVAPTSPHSRFRGFIGETMGVTLPGDLWSC